MSACRCSTRLRTYILKTQSGIRPRAVQVARAAHAERGTYQNDDPSKDSPVGAPFSLLSHSHPEDHGRFHVTWEVQGMQGIVIVEA